MRIAIAALILASSVEAAGIRGDAEKFFPIPNGIPQYEQSLDIGGKHVFSPMLATSERGFAGYSFIWIHGTPWLVPIYFPSEEMVHRLYPWLTYLPIAGDLCRYDFTC